MFYRPATLESGQSDDQSTNYIQHILINSASDLISLTNPNYQYVAARLLLFSLRKQVIGSISEKTILNQILEGKILDQISKLPIHEVMDESLPQVNDDAPLSLISSLLQVYPAVLISAKGDVKGIITKADFLKLL